MRTKMLEVSMLGVGTVLRLERNAWSTVIRLRQAKDEYATPSNSMDAVIHTQVSFKSDYL